MAMHVLLQTVSAFGSFLLHYCDWSKALHVVRRALVRLWRRHAPRAPPVVNASAAGASAGDVVPAGTAATGAASRACTYCDAPAAHLPTTALCGHTFCYVCLHSALLTEPEYECPECRTEVAGTH